MNTALIKRTALRFFLVFLSLTALVALVGVLVGSDNELWLKILISSLTITGASICALACAALAERRGRTGLATIGILSSVASALMLIAGYWTETEDMDYWKSSLSLGIAAVAFAHASLISLPALAGGSRRVLKLTIIAIAVLSLMTLVAMWAETEDELYFRILAAVAILVTLGSLAVPILARLGGAEVVAARRLQLVQLEGELYRDASGQRYLVREAPPADGPD